ncbi:MAG: hydantoinase B/oxoprolinase family protein, partial [Gammaproteobacteria bacterium AqS3]|nr:hydantoinase B/oxoprolinase family protein [Gammaproteobacteria bacterium AqS3]
TDIVAQDPAGRLHTHKLLSEQPAGGGDAVVTGIRHLLGLAEGEPIPPGLIGEVKVGTTVGTNALLERTGAPTLLVVNAGLGDCLRIGYQNRPDLFALDIRLPEVLYDDVLEVAGRLAADGGELEPLDLNTARSGLVRAREAGLESCAIALMHGYRHPQHEAALGRLAREVGFEQVSISGRVSPLMRLISRAQTTVVDAYLSPVLNRYVEGLSDTLDGAPLMFMRSSGSLTDRSRFQGRDCMLSGPAGGVVGAVAAAARAGCEKIIGFDMGGTSTDVSHYCGELERTGECEIAGVLMRTPMLDIHTIAAGGGSVLHFDAERFRVGPDSAGAQPGPACYRQGGPLTVTDCQVMLGRLPEDDFPAVFGPDGDEPIDTARVREQFAEWAERLGAGKSPEQLAEDFLDIAVENMARAIKRISTERGYDLADYTLVSFGGAAGQCACRVADSLGIARVLIHPLSGVLSAYGIGSAGVSAVREKSVHRVLDEALAPALEAGFAELAEAAEAEVRDQDPQAEIRFRRLVRIHYAGADAELEVPHGAIGDMLGEFERAHRRRFGFIDETADCVAASLFLEAGSRGAAADELADELADEPAADKTTSSDGGAEPAQAAEPIRHVTAHFGASLQVPVYRREQLPAGVDIPSPAIVIEATATTVIAPGWLGRLSPLGDLILERAEVEAEVKAEVEVGTGAETSPAASRRRAGRIDLARPDPSLLEIFNNRFMSIAEQMGAALRQSAVSVNIKERLDFSCALFDAEARLVANAPHIPVHLGSMSESVRCIAEARAGTMAPGDVYLQNDPYHGGTHLPDITVITPVFMGGELEFFVASRAHHADVGGIAPGSIPPHSTDIAEEGVLIDNAMLVRQGRFLEGEIRALLGGGPHPVRNPDGNIADLKAQAAANAQGVEQLHRLVADYGVEVVHAYMRFVHENADACVRRLIATLSDGRAEHPMDDGARIAVEVRIAPDGARTAIDFSGTSEQRPGNLNAPQAVTTAAVLYVLRCLVGEEIPLNSGCLRAVDLILPEGSLLNPRPPAAVVGGNVETSQCIVDALLAALGALAGSQGTCNNLTFGDGELQYYETVCGGAGAGDGFDGAGPVHTHITNTRLTDPEVLEWRYPVLLERFAVRADSGGAGRWRGGDGAVRHIRFLHPMHAGILSGRRSTAPPGLAGGGDGKPGRNAVRRTDGSVEELGGSADVEMNPGDVFIVETPGGGGFGPPPD